MDDAAMIMIMITAPATLTAQSTLSFTNTLYDTSIQTPGPSRDTLQLTAPNARAHNMAAATVLRTIKPTPTDRT